MSERWILLRGLARESGHWGDFPERMATELGVEVRAIDLPGTGEYRGVVSPITLSGIVDFVRARAREQSPPPYHLLTVSLGAMVACEWMRLYSEEIAGTVAINTSAANLSAFYDRLRWQVWSRFFKLLSIAAPRDREREIIELLINDPAQRARAWPLWTKLATERPIGFRTFANQLWSAGRGRVALPTGARGLVLNGLGDRLVDPSCSTVLAEVTGWPIKRHPWAGHDLPWDDPEWVISRVREWRG